jgi:hypothetical protein
MTIHWQFLLLSLALLLPPMPLSPSVRRYVVSVRRNAYASIPAMLKQWQNWVDLIRAGLGVYVLTQFACVPDPEIKGAAFKTLVFEGVVLSAALIPQMVRLGSTIRLIAPIFYLCGLTLVLAGYIDGGFAVFTGWLFAIGGKRPAFEIPIMGLALPVVEYVLDSTLSFPVILNCALIFMPSLLSILFQKPLAFIASESQAPDSSP